MTRTIQQGQVGLKQWIPRLQAIEATLLSRTLNICQARSYSPVWFISSTTSAKAPGCAEMCLTLPQYCKTFDICLAVRVFANGPGHLGSIPGRVIPKTQKMVLDASLLNIQHYKVQIKGKVKQSREGIAPSPTPWCSSYRKGSLRVTLDYGRQLYLLTYY